MDLKGLDKLREKLPDYPERRLGILVLPGFLGSIFAYIFLITLDILPRVFGDIQFFVLVEPYLPIIGNIIIGTIALGLIGRVWNQRIKLKEKYGNLAYQHIIRTGFAGVFLVPPIVFHGFTSIRSLPPGPPVNEQAIQWSQSLLPLIGVPYEIDLLVRLGISVFFLIIAIATVRSALFTFGLDYMAVVYLYFPEESEVQENEIYSVIRHPAYLSAIFFGIAALFFRFSVYSIITCILIYLIMRVQIRREEKELVERFGSSYTDYMSQVPALFVTPRNYGKFFRFLRGGNS